MDTYWNDGTELYHYGILGQRWGERRFQNEDGTYTEEGRRRYGRNTRNTNYASDQRSRDRRVYGRGGERRINRHMNEGDSISAARSREANRINTTRMIAKGAANAGAIAGGIAGYLVGKKYTDILVSKLGLPANDPTITMMVSAGIGAAGSSLGRIGGKSVAMIVGGYDPRKFRYV